LIESFGAEMFDTVNALGLKIHELN